MDTSHYKILTLEENPERHEGIIAAQQDDPAEAIQRLLRSIYLEKDRAGAFARFRNGYEFRTILRLLDMFGVPKAARLCEIGGGAGFLAWALNQAGFDDVTLLEPNGQYTTGTGYLRAREDARALRINNDLKAWHAADDIYDVIVTKNCIHHFQNISQAAASIRQKLKPNARWFAFREQFADTPQELYGLFNTHPYCQPYGLYEWSYPASHYAEAIEIAGFTLTAVVPAGYANNTLSTYQESEGGGDIQDLTRQIDDMLAKNPRAGVQAFWEEVLRNRFQQGSNRFFTRPQLMVFDVKAV